MVTAPKRLRCEIPSSRAAAVSDSFGCASSAGSLGVCLYAHIGIDSGIVVAEKLSFRQRMPVDDCSDILKALSDRTRQRIIKALLGADLNVNELTEKLGLSQYNTSKHLRVLKQAGI